MKKATHLRLIDKPVGMSSFDVVRALRQRTGVQKIGHAGTLDPLANGLLLVGIGKEGTAQLSHLTKLDKTYHVSAILGMRTDTGDMEGNVVEKKRVDPVSTTEQIEHVLENLVGTVDLRVPVYSAVKVGGEPLYKKARRGEEVEPPTRPMRIDDMSLRDIWPEERRVRIDMTMTVGSGVYVRSVVEEIGNRLGYPATTTELRRTRIGEFRVENAEPLEDI